MMDQNLKHRLTGAIILVSLAVIFIPVILEGPDNEWAPLSHSIPDPPRIDYKAAPGLPQPAAVRAPTKPSGEAAQQPAHRPAEPAEKIARVEAPKSKPGVGAGSEPVKAVKTQAGPLTGWYVQVGSFSQELNARGLSKRLKLSGYDSRLQKTVSAAGPAWRVMVGPGKNRVAAEKLRDKLASERQLKGLVINNPG